MAEPAHHFHCGDNNVNCVQQMIRSLCQPSGSIRNFVLDRKARQSGRTSAVDEQSHRWTGTTPLFIVTANGLCSQTLEADQGVLLVDQDEG